MSDQVLSAEPSTDASADGWGWYAARGDTAEACTIGPYDSREQVIATGRQDFDGDAFTIIEARKGTLRQYMPDADRIIEIMLEQADDDGAFGDDGYAGDNINDTTAAEADLNSALKDWFARHEGVFGKPWVFSETRNEETLPALPEDGSQTPPASDGEAQRSGATEQ